MQKIKTLFLRSEIDLKRVTSDVHPECQWVIDGEGTPTVKYDGTCCAIVDNVLFARHRHKAEKGDPPRNWMHWSGDPSVRHGTGWRPVSVDNPSDRRHCEAMPGPFPNGTYELIGPKVQGNPYALDANCLVQHGLDKISDLTLDHSQAFHGIWTWLADHDGEGIVWWHPDGRLAKIKRRDFGLPW